METILCFSCGTKIQRHSTFCPDCGEKQKSEIKVSDNKFNISPILKKWWFIALVIIFLVNLFYSLDKVICINCNGNGKTI